MVAGPEMEVRLLRAEGASRPVFRASRGICGKSKEQRRSAAEEAATACSDVRSTAEQQQGSTGELKPLMLRAGTNLEMGLQRTTT